MRAAEGERREFDYLISAVPFQVLAKLMPPVMQSDALREDLAQLRTSPITGIHFWFDREVTELDHAVLLDRTIQWMFQKSKILAGQAPCGRCAAGRQLPGTGRQLVEDTGGEVAARGA